MSALTEVFEKHKPALICYLTVGYPSIEATRRLVPLLAESGCDIVELGIPFSDPMADGATIQKAAHQALLNGVTPRLCLDLASELRNQTDVALTFMTYYNLVFHHGLEEFCQRAAAAGVCGLIIPDLPPDEGYELQSAAERRGIDLVYLLAPTSDERRIRLVADRGKGFIYLVSIAGVTGAREALPAELEAFIERVRRVARQPLAVGFGIGNPEQAARVSRAADGVIVGSKLLQIVEQDDCEFSQVRAFVRSLKSAMMGERNN